MSDAVIYRDISSAIYLCNVVTDLAAADQMPFGLSRILCGPEESLSTVPAGKEGVFGKPEVLQVP